MKKLYYTEEEKRLAVNGWRRGYASKNRNKTREWARESYHRRKNNTETIQYYLWKYAKARAIKKNLEFSIEKEDIILPDICPIMKIHFDRNTIRYGYSIDRKDPNKGYTKDNIWVISQIANAMKWNSTREERISFANWVLTSEKGM